MEREEDFWSHCDSGIGNLLDALKLLQKYGDPGEQIVADRLERLVSELIALLQ